MLIQIDKLVQLLESPVFTCASPRTVARFVLIFTDLRLQLLEPEKFPHLYKCLYGLLMLLPQSAAFAALKNRLNSVSAIGYLHIAPRTYVPSPPFSSSQTRNNSVFESTSSFAPFKNPISDSSHTPRNSAPTTATPSTYDRPNRLKGRDEGIRWGELLDKFRSVQEKARRAQQIGNEFDDGFAFADDNHAAGLDSKVFKDLVRLPGPPLPMKDVPVTATQKTRTGLGKFGRLGGGNKAKK